MKCITVEMLRKHGACRDQVRKFETIFPKGAPVTMRSLTKAQKAGLDVFFCKRFLAGPALAEYEKVVDLARAEYKKVVGPALAEYEKVVDLARAEYKKVVGPARAEYKKVVGPALAEYKKVVGPALAEYKKVVDLAWAEYEKVVDLAWAEYEKVVRSALIAALAQEKPEADGESTNKIGPITKSVV
jgi:hypothetical protein